MSLVGKFSFIQQCLIVICKVELQSWHIRCISGMHGICSSPC